MIGYVLPRNKREWKYYLNICGEYHATDTPMYVTSLDTLEDIVFNKSNMGIHTATAHAYQYGSRYYYSLVDKYPEHEELVKGILNPADLTEAVESADGSILAYDGRFIESQEATLISDLQKFIYKHKIRWSVPSYRTSDNLYPASEHAVLCLNLVPALMNIRLNRTRTEEVHSFYIRQYLASNFKLDAHYGHLTMKQRLWLYRNISRLSKNFGKNIQFDEIMDKVLTERSIPLSGYTVRHLDEMNEDMTPVTVARKELLNGPVNTTEQTYSDVSVLMAKNIDSIPGNPIELNDRLPEMLDLLKNSPSSVVATKMLESSMVDYTDAATDRLNEVLLRELISGICHNRYTAYCEYKDPKTGEFVTLAVKDALIYLVYLSYKRAGIPIETVPTIMCPKFLLDPFPTRKELLRILDDEYPQKQKVVDYLLNIFPRPTILRSVSAFQERAYAIYEACLKCWLLISNVDDLYQRGEAEKAYMRMFGYQEMTIEANSLPISEWLVRTNTPRYSYTPEEAEELMYSLFTSMTGVNIDNVNSVPFIQKSLVELMEKLTSYSVQYVANINENPIVLLNRIAVRHTAPISEGFNTIPENPLVDVLALRASAMDRHNLDKQLNINLSVKQGMQAAIKKEINPVVKTNISLEHYTVRRVNPNFPRVTAYSSTGEAYDDNIPFIGYEYYKQMTQEQIKSVPNVD